MKQAALVLIALALVGCSTTTPTSNPNDTSFDNFGPAWESSKSPVDIGAFLTWDNPVIDEATGKPVDHGLLFAVETAEVEEVDQSWGPSQPMTSVLESSPRHGALSFSSPDAKTYYMAADIGSAFRASDYRAKTKLGAVAKAPFVAAMQVGKAVIRIPGAMIANAKADPVEAIVQGLVIAGVAGSQTEWFGIAKDSGEKDKKGFKTESAPLPHPELGLSLVQTHASRQQCSATGPSGKPIKIAAEFNDSGSSKCNIEAGEFPEAE